MTEEQFKGLCEKALYTQSEIDEINKARCILAYKSGYIYTPYIPMFTELGPVVKPENG